MMKNQPQTRVALIFKAQLMILEDFLIFLPIHHLASDVSIRPKQISPIQVVGGWVVGSTGYS